MSLITKPYLFGYKRGYCPYCEKRCPGRECHASCLNKALEKMVITELLQEKQAMKAKAELLHQTGKIHEYVDSHFEDIGEKKAGECLEIIKLLWAKLERRK